MCTLDRITMLIEDKGITQQEFLRSIGLNKSALSDWKKGINKSYKKHIDKIADYFGVSVDYLLGKTDIPSTPTPEQRDEFAEETKDLSPDERERVKEYIKFVKSQRK